MISDDTSSIQRHQLLSNGANRDMRGSGLDTNVQANAGELSLSTTVQELSLPRGGHHARHGDPNGTGF